MGADRLGTACNMQKLMNAKYFSFNFSYAALGSGQNRPLLSRLFFSFCPLSTPSIFSKRTLTMFGHKACNENIQIRLEGNGDLYR